MTSSRYVGSELTVFAHAVNWKSYLASHLRPFLVGDVLEVGAGIGTTTCALCDGTQRRWVCLEPDPVLAQALVENDALARRQCEVIAGSIERLPASQRFDAILYVDVLEHIKDDKGELAHAAARLNPNGTLIVLAPAHQFLFTPFDRAIGHYRRYNKASLRAAAPTGLKVEKLLYLDSIGGVASLGNRLLLQSQAPRPSQVYFWDRVLVSCSRLMDPLVRYRIGKSVLGVWRRP